jgi:hypothetical protein
MPQSAEVLYGPLRPTSQSAARATRAFTIKDIANGLPTDGATVACRVAARASGVFVAARPIE